MVFDTIVIKFLAMIFVKFRLNYVIVQTNLQSSEKGWLPMRLSLSLLLATLFFVGCATNATVSPSQNPSLQAVSPNTAASSEGGAMQRSLDTWLKEEWTPLTAPAATKPKEDATKSVEVDSTASKAEDEKPFTLQSFADKWKVYHENEAKMKEGKPKEPSHIDAVNALPVIGK